MSKEEAINLLKQVNHILVNDDDYWTENTHEPLNTAFSMAIKALEQQDRIAQILDNYDLPDTWEILDDYDLLEAWEVLKMVKEAMRK